MLRLVFSIFSFSLYLSSPVLFNLLSFVSILSFFTRCHLYNYPLPPSVFVYLVAADSCNSSNRSPRDGIIFRFHRIGPVQMAQSRTVRLLFIIPVHPASLFTSINTHCRLNQSQLKFTPSKHTPAPVERNHHLSGSCL